MSEYNLGTASGKIEIDGRAASLGFKVAETAASAFFDVVKMRVDAVQNLGKRVAAVGAGGVAGFGLAVKTAASFQQQMSGVQAVTGSTGKEFDSLREKALKLGADTSFSASEAALAIEELAKAGIPVADILNGAADATVALAAAGGVSLPEAATIAANAMNQFGIAAGEVNTVADILAGVANTSAADVSGIGQSLSQAGAVANLAGLSFRDTAIAIGEMADAGINGSDAGTSIKTMLNNLIPVTDKQKAKFKELGLLTENLAKSNKVLAAEGLPVQKSMEGVRSVLGKYMEEMGKGKVGTQRNTRAMDELLQKTGGLRNQFFKANGEIKNLRGLQDTLGKSLQGLTKEQKLATLETLFGADAMRATAILSLAGAKGYDKFSAAVEKTSAADVAKVRLNNLSGASEQFSGAMETAMITIGNVFLPAVTKIVQGATALVNVFNNLPGPVKTAIAILALVASSGMLVVGAILAMLPLILSMVANFLLMRVVSSVVSSLKVFHGALKAGQGIMAASTLSSTRLGAAMTTLGKRSLLAGKIMMISGKMIRAAWLMAMGPIGIAIVAVAALAAIGYQLYQKWTPFRELVNKIGAAIKEHLIAAWQAAQPAIAVVVSALQKFGNFIKSTLLPVLQQIGVQLLGKLMSGFNAIKGAVAGQLMPAFNSLVGAFRSLGPAASATGGFLATVGSALASVGAAVGGFLLPILTKLGEIFISFILPVLLKVAGFLVGVLIDSVVGFVKAVIQAITGIIQIFTGLINFFKGLFTGNWSLMWSGLVSIFKGVWNLIVGLLKAYLYVGMLKMVGLAFKGLWAIVRGGWNVILSIFKGVGRGLWAVVKGIFRFILTIIRGYINMWRAIFRVGWNGIKAVVQGALKAVQNIVKGVLRFIGALIKGQINTARSIFKSGWNAIRDTTKNAFNKIKDAVGDGIRNAIRIIKDFPGKAKSALGNLGSTLLNAGKNLIQGLIDGIGAKIGDAVQRVRDGLSRIRSLLPGSPIKEGPLTGWNNTGRNGPGGRLMGLLADGIAKEQDRVIAAATTAMSGVQNAISSNSAMLSTDVMATVRPTATPLVAPASAGARRAAPPAGQNGKYRLVEGRLLLDKSGRAFIRGVAEEVVDDNNTFQARRRK